MADFQKDPSIPIIDLSELKFPEKRKVFFQKLRFMAREIGFFYLVGHGIHKKDRQDLLNLMKEFFSLPLEEKNKISMIHSRHFRGFTFLKEENTRNIPDYREQLDIGQELSALELDQNDPIWYSLYGPNQWPESIPDLKVKALAWQESLRQLSIRLIRLFLEALELPNTLLDKTFEGIPIDLLKLIHYPGSDSIEDKQGVGPHKDSDYTTLLWQDSVGGLQVKTDKGWIDVPPIEDAFIVNIGETLELATNGYLRANIHQVITPKNSVDRYSIAYFIKPGFHIGEIPLLPLPKHLAELALGPETDPMNPLFRNIGENSIKGRFRSHLDVTKKFYPEYYKQIVS